MVFDAVVDIGQKVDRRGIKTDALGCANFSTFSIMVRGHKMRKGLMMRPVLAILTLLQVIILFLELSAFAGAQSMEELSKDADSPVPGGEKKGKKNDDFQDNLKVEKESSEEPTNFFAALAIDADGYVESDYAAARDFRAAKTTLEELMKAPLTASMSSVIDEALIRHSAAAAFEANKSSLMEDRLGSVAAQLSDALDRLRNETQIFVTEIDNAGLDVDDRSEEDAQSIENSVGRINQASLRVGQLVTTLVSSAESSILENIERRKAILMMFNATAARQRRALSTLESFESESTEIISQRQRSVQFLEDELAAIEASLTSEQKTLLGAKVVNALKQELKEASKEQTSNLIHAQLAHQNATVSNFRCSASLDLSQRASDEVEAAQTLEGGFQRAFADILEAAKKYASMESIYAELAKDGRNESALLLLREGTSPERLAFEAAEVEALIVRKKVSESLADEHKKVSDAAHMLALALSSENAALKAMGIIRDSQQQAVGAFNAMSSSASASALHTAVARSDLPNSGGANISAVASKTESSLSLEHLLDLAAEGDYGSHLLSRLDATPWVEDNEFQVEEQEEIARGKGREPSSLPTDTRVDGTPAGALPGEARSNSTVLSLAILGEEGKARADSDSAVKSATLDTRKAKIAGEVSAALIKALSKKNLTLDAQVLLRSRLVEAQSAEMALLERAKAERETSEGDRSVYEAILNLRNQRKKLTASATKAIAARARAEVTYEEAIEEEKSHPVKRPERADSSTNTTTGINTTTAAAAPHIEPAIWATKAAKDQLHLADFLADVENATLLVGDAEGHVAKETRSVLESMKLAEDATSDLLEAEKRADTGIDGTISFNSRGANIIDGTVLQTKSMSSEDNTSSPINNSGKTNSLGVYEEARQAIQESGQTSKFSTLILQKDEFRHAEEAEGGDVSLAKKLARDTEETTDVLREFFLPENARAGASAEHASAELARERAKALLMGRQERHGADPASEPSVQQHIAVLQAKVAYLNALHKATVAKEERVARGVARLKQMNAKIASHGEASDQLKNKAWYVKKAAENTQMLNDLANTTSFAQKTKSRLLRAMPLK